MSVSNVARLPISSTVDEIQNTRTAPEKKPTVDVQKIATAVLQSKQEIAGLGEDLEKLDTLERASLKPAFAVLKETLEELSGDPDDEHFKNPNKQAQMKEMRFALEVHARQFNAYVTARTGTNLGTESYLKICKNVGGICSELTTSLKTQADSDEAEEKTIVEDKSKNMSTVEFKTFQLSLLSATKKLAMERQAAPAQFIKLTKNAWETTCKAESRLQAGLNFLGGQGVNSTSIASLKIIEEKLSDQITKLKGHISTHQANLNSLTAWTENQAECDRMLAHMEKIYEQLSDQIKVIEDYQSPDNKQKICNAKKIEIQATINILKSQPQSDKIKSLIATLENRITSLKNFPKTEFEEQFTNAQLMGEKEIKGIGKLFNFSLANKQESMLRHMTNLLTDRVNPDSCSLATEYFTERMLMQKVLEKAGINDASKQLKASISRELNSTEWSIIESEFTVPVEDTAHQSQVAAIVKATTTPAGQIFANPHLIQITSKDSPITASTTDEYKHTDHEGKTVNGGINSHCSTEVNHVTTAATTSCTVNGEEVFGATRHGTLAPYGLDEVGIKAIPNGELGKTIQSLFGKAKVENTSITAGSINDTSTPTNTDNSTDTSTHTKTRTSGDDIKRSDDPIRNELIGKLKTILLNSTTGDQWLTQIGTNRQLVLNDSQMLDSAIENLFNKPELQTVLASLVKAHPVLGEFLQRQGALNRAREVFMLEMTHNPQFLEQIKNGEEVLFTSVGLLTPDNLRHQLHKLFGLSASGDEKEMVAIQAQAWDDLRKEIAADRIVINGDVVRADILDFNLGVNKGATILATNPVIGEAVSGWDFVNDVINNRSMDNLVAVTAKRLAKKDSELRLKIDSQKRETDPAKLKKLDSEIIALNRDIATIKELSTQIAAIWEDGSYREAGSEPYKLPSRVALLSYLLGGGTVFNCKSGKDRTAQLDVEVKFLAFQIRTSNGKVPKPDRKRTNLEKVQFSTFIFFDESRRKMQEFNTGYGGSKLVSQPALYGNFTPSTGDAKVDKKNKAATISQFQGQSGAVPS
ncbi:MAG: hypothetical protein LW714_09045 [Oxalobacteraceae bacterium]|jgi:hypothetical protein|nr:hypothetical protein [Oxalobacteraceae bacterium]